MSTRNMFVAHETSLTKKKGETEEQKGEMRKTENKQLVSKYINN